MQLNCFVFFVFVGVKYLRYPAKFSLFLDVPDLYVYMCIHMYLSMWLCYFLLFFSVYTMIHVYVLVCMWCAYMHASMCYRYVRVKLYIYECVQMIYSVRFLDRFKKLTFAEKTSIYVNIYYLLFIIRKSFHFFFNENYSKSWNRIIFFY